MEFSDLLQTRCSVRSYEKCSITIDEVNALLEAGVRAPNACNYQSWHFYAIADEKIIAQFHPEIAKIPWWENIPLVIVVCMKDAIMDKLAERFGERGKMFVMQDAAGAINHILLKAADMGLGGCWIGPMDVEKCKKLVGIAEGHTPAAILTIGKPAGKSVLRERLPLSDVVTVVGEIPTK